MARPIDKETMLDLIIKAKRTDPETGSFAEWLAEYLVEHLPTLTQPNEWVSVEDRLPEDDLPEGTNRLQIKVLVAIKAKNGYTVRTQNRIRQEQSWSNKEPFTAWYWKFSHGEDTHWMPLPSPPDRPKE